MAQVARIDFSPGVCNLEGEFVRWMRLSLSSQKG